MAHRLTRTGSLLTPQPQGRHGQQGDEDHQEEDRYPHLPASGCVPSRQCSRSTPQDRTPGVKRAHPAQLPQGSYGLSVISLRFHADAGTPKHALHQPQQAQRPKRLYERATEQRLGRASQPPRAPVSVRPVVAGVDAMVAYVHCPLPPELQRVAVDPLRRPRWPADSAEDAVSVSMVGSPRPVHGPARAPPPFCEWSTGGMRSTPAGCGRAQQEAESTSVRRGRSTDTPPADALPLPDPSALDRRHLPHTARKLRMVGSPRRRTVLSVPTPTSGRPQRHRRARAFRGVGGGGYNWPDSCVASALRVYCLPTYPMGHRSSGHSGSGGDRAANAL
jgi:hypothetical protein